MQKKKAFWTPILNFLRRDKIIVIHHRCLYTTITFHYIEFEFQSCSDNVYYETQRVLSVVDMRAI